MPAMRKRIRAFTDGSCDTVSGDGGWAYLLDYRGHQQTLSGYEAGTTNNRMELTAAVRALSALTEPCDVTMVTDSEYLKKAFTDGWLTSWQRNGWKTAARRPVKNQDLWRQLLDLTDLHHVTWTWTRGHAGQPENERVDRLAQKARRSKKAA